MDAVYHWVGFVVTWLAVAALLIAIGFTANEYLLRPHLGNAWLWIKIFIFRHRFVTSRHKARVLTSAYQKTRQLAWWTRGMLAYSIRQARREGRRTYIPRQKKAA